MRRRQQCEKKYEAIDAAHICDAASEAAGDLRGCACAGMVGNTQEHLVGARGGVNAGTSGL